MYKYLILLLLLVIPITYSETYITDEIQNVYNITKCNGPILIKVIGLEDVKFDRCVLKEDIFECQCKDKFNINMLAKQESNIIINIEYYTSYLKNMSTNELSNYKRNVRLDKVKIIDKNKNIITKLDIDPMKALFGGAMFAILLFVILFKKYKNSINISNNDDNDSLNYFTTQKEFEEYFKK